MPKTKKINEVKHWSKQETAAEGRTQRRWGCVEGGEDQRKRHPNFWGKTQWRRWSQTWGTPGPETDLMLGQSGPIGGEKRGGVIMEERSEDGLA